MKKPTSGTIKLLSSMLLLGLINITCECLYGNDRIDRIRPWPDNPHYLAWSGTPVFLLEHEAAGHLGHFIARLPFWRMHPCHDVVNILPEAAGTNVLADPGSHYVIQLIGGNHGEKPGIVVPSGRWTVEWIDPSTGTELKKYEIVIDSGTQELEIHGELNHRIIYLYMV